MRLRLEADGLESTSTGVWEGLEDTEGFCCLEAGEYD